MKKVIFLNGSPKRKRAVSEKFLKIAEDCLEGQIRGEKLYIYESEFSDGFFESIYEADAVVMALPLYIDCLPARVLEFMTESKEYLKNRELRIPELYFIIKDGGRIGACAADEVVTQNDDGKTRNSHILLRGGVDERKF